MTGINNTKAKAREKAEKEIKTKLQLEKKMKEDLEIFFKQLASDYETVYSSTGKVLSLNESYQDELNALLKRNYRGVSDIFDKTIRKDIDDVIDAEKWEANEDSQRDLKEKIAMTIGAYLLLRANTITPKIAVTVQEELKKKTEAVIVENAERGVAVSNAEVASTVANEFEEWGVKHSPIISVTEVQDVAESSKHTEHLTINELVEDKTLLQKGSQKVWITAGDEKVRQSHVILDGVSIGSDDVFVTGKGGKMRYSGDMTMGALLSDVINCRCETIYRYNTEVLGVIRNKIYKRK